MRVNNGIMFLNPPMNCPWQSNDPKICKNVNKRLRRNCHSLCNALEERNATKNYMINKLFKRPTDVKLSEKTKIDRLIKLLPQVSQCQILKDLIASDITKMPRKILPYPGPSSKGGESSDHPPLTFIGPKMRGPMNNGSQIIKLKTFPNQTPIGSEQRPIAHASTLAPNKLATALEESKSSEAELIDEFAKKHNIPSCITVTRRKCAKYVLGKNDKKILNLKRLTPSNSLSSAALAARGADAASARANLARHILTSKPISPKIVAGPSYARPSGNSATYTLTSASVNQQNVSGLSSAGRSANLVPRILNCRPVNPQIRLNSPANALATNSENKRDVPVIENIDLTGDTPASTAAALPNINRQITGIWIKTDTLKSPSSGATNRRGPIRILPKGILNQPSSLSTIAKLKAGTYTLICNPINQQNLTTAPPDKTSTTYSDVLPTISNNQLNVASSSPMIANASPVTATVTSAVVNPFSIFETNEDESVQFNALEELTDNATDSSNANREESMMLKKDKKKYADKVYMPKHRKLTTRKPNRQEIDKNGNDIQAIMSSSESETGSVSQNTVCQYENTGDLVAGSVKAANNAMHITQPSQIVEGPTFRKNCSNFDINDMGDIEFIGETTGQDDSTLLEAASPRLVIDEDYDDRSSAQENMQVYDFRESVEKPVTYTEFKNGSQSKDKVGVLLKKSRFGYESSLL